MRHASPSRSLQTLYYVARAHVWVRVRACARACVCVCVCPLRHERNMLCNRLSCMPKKSTSLPDPQIATKTYARSQRTDFDDNYVQT